MIERSYMSEDVQNSEPKGGIDLPKSNTMWVFHEFRDDNEGLEREWSKIEGNKKTLAIVTDFLQKETSRTTTDDIYLTIRKIDKGIEEGDVDKDSTSYFRKQLFQKMEEMVGETKEKMEGEYGEKIEEMAYDKLREKMMDAENDEYKVLKIEQEKRIAELEEKEVFDRKRLRSVITTTLKESNWDNYYSKLINKGVIQEQEAIASHNELKDDKRYTGVIRHVFEAAANQTMLQGLRFKEADFEEEESERFIVKKFQGTNFSESRVDGNKDKAKEILEELERSKKGSPLRLREVQLNTFVGEEERKKKKEEEEAGIVEEEQPNAKDLVKAVKHLENQMTTLLAANLNELMRQTSHLSTIGKDIRVVRDKLLKGEVAAGEDIEKAAVGYSEDINKAFKAGGGLDIMYGALVSQAETVARMGESEQTQYLRSIAESQQKLLELEEAESPPELIIPTKNKAGNLIFKEDIELYLEQNEGMGKEQAEEKVLDMYKQKFESDKTEDKEWVKEHGKRVEAKYLSEMNSWFERRLRDLESRDETFEERSELFQPLLIATMRLKYSSVDAEKKRGIELANQLEARRARQRMVRVWNLSLPDQIYQASYVLNSDKIQTLFTFDSEENGGTGLVLEEFNKFIEMGDEYKRKKGDKEKNPILEKIQDYYFKGGKDEATGEYVDDLIKKLELTPNLSEADKNRLENLKNKLWARKFAGGLYSITFEAAKDNVMLNGTGDFFAKRVFNMGDFMDEVLPAQATRKIWRPDEDDHSKDFNLGYDGFFDSIAGKLQFEEEGRGGTRSRVKRKSSDKKEFLGIVYKSLGNEDFWHLVRTGGGEIDLGEGKRLVAKKDEDKWSTSRLQDDEYNATRLYKYTLADETRKELVGDKKFFYTNPNIDNLGGDEFLKRFINAAEKFQHLDHKVKLDNRRLDGLMGYLSSYDVHSSERSLKVEELMDRIFKWGRSKEGKRESDKFRIFGVGEVTKWIDEAKANNLITKDQTTELIDGNNGILGKVPFIGEKLAYKWDMNIRAMFTNPPIVVPKEKQPQRKEGVTDIFKDYFKSAFKN